MAMKFHGDLTALKRLLDHHDILGTWEAKPNGVHMLRCPEGANLHWAAGGKTLWFSGKPVEAARLEMRMARLLSRLCTTAEP
jgi:hypothetical protein